MNREKILSGNTRQYITINECDMLEQIEKLLPEYKSFNQLANDALRLGLPLLLEEKFNKEIKLEEGKSTAQVCRVERVVEERHIPDECLKEMVRLLQEIVMTTTISKALTCSLFNAKSDELNGHPIPAKKFDNGAMRDTPICMMKYEIDRLNEMDD